MPDIFTTVFEGCLTTGWVTLPAANPPPYPQPNPGRRCPHPLVALMGCVVPTTAGIKAPISSIGNFDIEASVAEDAFLRPEVHLQPATAAPPCGPAGPGPSRM